MKTNRGLCYVVVVVVSVCFRSLFGLDLVRTPLDPLIHSASHCVGESFGFFKQEEELKTSPLWSGAQIPLRRERHNMKFFMTYTVLQTKMAGEHVFGNV